MDFMVHLFSGTGIAGMRQQNLGKASRQNQAPALSRVPLSTKPCIQRRTKNKPSNPVAVEPNFKFGNHVDHWGIPSSPSLFIAAVHLPTVDYRSACQLEQWCAATVRCAMAHSSYRHDEKIAAKPNLAATLHHPVRKSPKISTDLSRRPPSRRQDLYIPEKHIHPAFQQRDPRRPGRLGRQGRT